MRRKASEKAAAVALDFIGFGIGDLNGSATVGNLHDLLRYNRMEKRTPSYMAQNARVTQQRMVTAPARHDGIGNALRTAFDPDSFGLPDDFTRLLNKLDK